MLSGLFDVGMVGMDCGNEALECVPFYQDRMVLVTSVVPKFLEMNQKAFMLGWQA